MKLWIQLQALIQGRGIHRGSWNVFPTVKGGTTVKAVTGVNDFCRLGDFTSDAHPHLNSDLCCAKEDRGRGWSAQGKIGAGWGKEQK